MGRDAGPFQGLVRCTTTRLEYQANSLGVRVLDPAVTHILHKKHYNYNMLFQY